MRKLLVLLTILVAGYARAELRLAPLFCDHAVLQREKPVPVWGWADPGQNVKVTFHKYTVEATAAADGRWQVMLPAMKASAEPAELVVSAGETRTVHDVVIGEVWLCSGQSNMEWHVRDVTNAEQEIASANFPMIRHFRTPHLIATEPQQDFAGGAWAVTTPKTVISFSAVAYFFARDLHRDLNVPIGLINTSWGGKMIEVFMSRELLASDPVLTGADKRWKQEQDRLPAMLAAYEKKAATAKPGTNPDGTATSDEAAPKGMNPREVVAQHRPACLFNAMMNPVFPYGLRGVIWYQGEHNISRAAEYRVQFPAMITDWRKRFQQGDIPFYFVQLANFAATMDKSREGYALLREAQLQTLALTNTGMAVTIDIGTPENIHPRNKQDVGARLARIAKAKTYNRGGEWSGPVFQSAVREKNTLRLSFEHVAGGLVLKETPAPAFEVAGADGKYRPASARVDGSALIVQSESVSDPMGVRYAWANAPQAVLFNSEVLPASPFRQQLSQNK